MLASGQAVLAEIIGHCPPGLTRALRVLPDVVLGPENYRALVGLLNDKATATFLHHRRSINEPIIAGLAALPIPLRRFPIFKLFDHVEGVDRFMHGLQHLSCRAGIACDALIAQLGAYDQTEQVIARIVELADSLPLVDGLPSPQIGCFRRVDSVPEIRALAKAWANCLGNALHDISAGTSAVYLSSYDGPPAVALVGRADRLGWVVVQIKGPRNVDLDAASLLAHHNAFAEAGIPRSGDVAAIKDLILQSRWSRQLRR